MRKLFLLNFKQNTPVYFYGEKGIFFKLYFYVTFQWF